MTATDQVIVRFSRSIQKLGPIQEAAYRVLGTASCRIEANEQEYICTLHPKSSGSRENRDAAEVHKLFLDAVTDENLREKVESETHQVRNLLLALAFGAWSRPNPAKDGP
jgi:His-Xaa-Ser system protein HxsD